MIAVARFIALIILISFPSQLTPALARASSFEDKIWDTGNVSVLPPEVRKRLTRMCGPDLVAEPYFAGYFANSKVLVLHFGRLRCGSQTGICIQGRCLHQIYGRKGGQYRLLNSYYGPNDD